jgi:hypothetical protein
MSTPQKRGRKTGEPTFDQMVQEAGGDEVIFGRIAQGETVESVMQSHGRGRKMFYAWIRTGGEERRERFEEAQRLSAEALVDQGGEILDQAAAAGSTAQVMAAKSRAEWRKWLAGVRAPDTYGDKSGVQISVNIGQLHLDALRVAGRVVRPALGPVQDAEVLAIESGEEVDG